MLLEDKAAIVYGGGGLIGGAVARAFAREGARVFLAGRTPATLDAVAGDISAAGGMVETARVDALDERSVEEHVGAVVARAGSIDVSFNAMGIRGELQGTPLVAISQEDFAAPILTGATGQFLTARAAARRMLEQRSGAILLLTATATWSQAALRMPIPMGGFGVACAAIEGLARSLAGELGPRGIRVVCLRSEGVAEVAHGFSSDTAAAIGLSPGELADPEAAARGRDAASATADGGRPRQRGHVHGFRPRRRDDGHCGQRVLRGSRRLKDVRRSSIRGDRLQDALDAVMGAAVGDPIASLATPLKRRAPVLGVADVGVGAASE
jgi:3-oxoacyl-[acyl-carrier protein] reductase